MEEAAVFPRDVRKAVDTMQQGAKPTSVKRVDKVMGESDRQAKKNEAATEKKYAAQVKKNEVDANFPKELRLENESPFILKVAKLVKEKQRLRQLRENDEVLSLNPELFQLVDSETASSLQQTVVDRLDQKLTELGISRQNLQEIWDKRLEGLNKNPPEMGSPFNENSVGLSDESEQTFIKYEHIRRNETFQRKQLADRLVANKDVLLSPAGERNPEKIKALQELQQLFEAVEALEEQSARLELRLARREENRFGAMDTVKSTKDRIKAEAEAHAKPALDLAVIRKDANTQAKIDALCTDLRKQIDEVRQKEGKKPLTDTQFARLQEKLGYIPAKDGKEADVWEKSTLESLLLAHGLHTKAGEVLGTVVNSADADVQLLGAEMGFILADVKVKGEAMDYIAHALAAGNLKANEVQEIIKQAQEMGVVADYDKFEKIIHGSGEFFETIAPKVNSMIHEGFGKIEKFFTDLAQDPEKRKKLLKYLAIGILALIVAIAAVVLVTGSAMAQGMGGGR